MRVFGETLLDIVLRQFDDETKMYILRKLGTLKFLKRTHEICEDVEMCDRASGARVFSSEKLAQNEIKRIESDTGYMFEAELLNDWQDDLQDNDTKLDQDHVSYDGFSRFECLIFDAVGALQSCDISERKRSYIVRKLDEIVDLVEKEVFGE